MEHKAELCAFLLLCGIGIHEINGQNQKRDLERLTKTTATQNVQVNLTEKIPNVFLESLAPKYASFWNALSNEFGTNTAKINSHLTLYLETELEGQKHEEDKELQGTYYSKARKGVITQQIRSLLLEHLARDSVHYKFPTSQVEPAKNEADWNLYCAQHVLDTEARSSLLPKSKRDAIVKDYIRLTDYSSTLFSGKDKLRLQEELQKSKERTLLKLQTE